MITKNMAFVNRNRRHMSISYIFFYRKIRQKQEIKYKNFYQKNPIYFFRLKRNFVKTFNAKKRKKSPSSPPHKKIDSQLFN